MNQKPQEVLADFHFACQLFYQGLHQAPSDDFFQNIKDIPFAEIWGKSSNSSIQEGVSLITNELQSSSDLNTIRQDFAALFVGPNVLRAAPWGSVYLTEEQTLCGESTLAVKAFYRECGLAIDTGEREPEDHLGLMFAFMADRITRMHDALEAGGSIDGDMDILKSFLTDHVLTWAPRFLEVLHDNAETSFYQGLSQLIEGNLQLMASFTGAEYKIVRLFR
ncbi:hypothetical protein ACH42_09040 [Endozoicomonas sp. (ex Bugula neritina AB1)]|nr:hypothetical protein ACH42_09040 [Endozoicomonas sp. (ex Bugula neritina AB1)]